MLIILYLLASVTCSSCCYNNVYCYICCQQVAITLQIEPDWSYFYLKNTAFFILLSWIHSFVLKLVDLSSEGLVYAKVDMLYINIL